MTLSPLQLKLYIALALMISLIAYEAVTRLDDRRKIKAGLAEDLRKDDTLLVKHNAVQQPKWRFWSEGLLIIATGIAIAVAMASLMDYQRHGAFYDASWRDPAVESHFEFDATANQDIEAAWRADPENFDWAAQRLCVVKLGCDDCERVAQTIHQLESDGYVTVFSRSDFGKAAVEKYGITYVPSVVMNGLVIQLRSGDSMVETEPPADRKTDGEIAQDILDGLMQDGGLATDENGNDPAAADPNYTKYGTKAAIEYAEEQERLKREQAEKEASGQN